jgi:hypothetical protein
MVRAAGAGKIDDGREARSGCRPAAAPRRAPTGGQRACRASARITWQPSSEPCRPSGVTFLDADGSGGIGVRLRAGEAPNREGSGDQGGGLSGDPPPLPRTFP